MRSPGPRPASRRKGSRRGRPTRSAEPDLLVHYEDRHLLVVEKPAGLLTVSPRDVGQPSAWSILRRRSRRREPGRGPAPRGSHGPGREPERIYLIHRLDRPASGLLLFAKTEPARAALKDLLASRKIERRYAAIVVGRPGEAEGELRSRLVELEDPRHRVRSLRRGDPPARRAKAREAITRYRVLGSRRGLAALELTLETGRKHQIRVHLAEAGHPVLGDRLYSGHPPRGGAGHGEARLHLHAWRIAFTHPFTRRRIEIVSPPGPEFERAVPGAFHRIG